MNSQPQSPERFFEGAFQAILIAEASGQYSVAAKLSLRHAQLFPPLQGRLLAAKYATYEGDTDAAIHLLPSPEEIKISDTLTFIQAQRLEVQAQTLSRYYFLQQTGDALASNISRLIRMLTESPDSLVSLELELDLNFSTIGQFYARQGEYNNTARAYFKHITDRLHSPHLHKASAYIDLARLHQPSRSNPCLPALELLDHAREELRLAGPNAPDLFRQRTREELCRQHFQPTTTLGLDNAAWLQRLSESAEIVLRCEAQPFSQYSPGPYQ